MQEIFFWKFNLELIVIGLKFYLIELSAGILGLV